MDNGLCNNEWRHLFPSTVVIHLTHAYSNHCLLLLMLDGMKTGGLGARLFRFQAAWLLHGDFLKWMEKEWVWNGNLTNLSEELL